MSFMNSSEDFTLICRPEILVVTACSFMSFSLEY